MSGSDIFKDSADFPILCFDKKIDKKIDNIFNSADYVYKADVKIVTDNDEVMSRRIVARNKNNLITIDNEFIPISSIRDIYK